MNDHCFSFLEDSYADICNEAMFCEKHLVEGDYAYSIIRAGKALEIITKSICKFSGMDFLISYNQFERLQTLFDRGIIDNNISKKLNHIRLIRNRILFESNIREIKDEAILTHQYLYEICVYFYKTYHDPNFIAEDYNGPIMDADS